MRGGQSVDAVTVQIESLAYDLDYKAKFTRAQFETEARDLKNNFALPIQEALARLRGGRTTFVIAHRLSTAENADEVIVFDRGRVVQRGPHAALVADGPSDTNVYGRLHASWVAQQSR